MGAMLSMIRTTEMCGNLQAEPNGEQQTSASPCTFEARHCRIQTSLSTSLYENCIFKPAGGAGPSFGKYKETSSLSLWVCFEHSAAL